MSRFFDRVILWLVFGVPRLGYHLVHLGVYGVLDRVLDGVALGGTVVLGALLVLPRRDDPARIVVSPAPTAPVGQTGDRG